MMSVEKSKNDFVPRITQLDAIEFDEEINNVLTNQLLEVGKYLKPGALNNLKPEISLIIRLLIFNYSLLRSNSSFGQQLLNVKYKDQLSTRKAVAFAVLSYIIPYAKHKYEESFTGSSSENVKNYIDKIELVLKACHTINLLIFLQEGVYPTLIDRILRLKYSPISKLGRNVGYSYMTRELLWHGFMELLMFTLPLINYQALKRKLGSFLSLKSKDNKNEKQINYNLDTKCAVCNGSPVLPCRISIFCPHLACYYCIKSNILADEKFICPTCSIENTAYEHLQFLNN